MKSDKPISAFDKDGVFKTDNWNDRTCNRIRSVLSLCKDRCSQDGLKIQKTWYNDQTYSIITDDDSESMFFMTWYKDRGRTENFLCFGYPITKKDALYLAKRLESLKIK